MRALLIVAAVVGCAVAVALAVNAVLAGRIEDRAARALREDVARQTGSEPEDVGVSLEGWLAALRLLTGPAPDATATIRGIAIPQTNGSLTRLRMTLDDVDADVGQALSGEEERSLPFSAASGRFSAVLSEEDLNATIARSDLYQRLELRDGAVVATVGGAVAEGEVTFTAELGGEPGDGSPVLVLRPAPTDSNARRLGPLLANSTLTVPLVLPDALVLERVRAEDGRIVGEGRVDTEALTEES